MCNLETHIGKDHFLGRQVWLVLGVKLRDIDGNLRFALMTLESLEQHRKVNLDFSYETGYPSENEHVPYEGTISKGKDRLLTIFFVGDMLVFGAAPLSYVVSRLGKDYVFLCQLIEPPKLNSLTAKWSWIH